MKKNRIFAVVIAMLLVVAMVAGCTPTTTSSGSGSSDASGSSSGGESSNTPSGEVIKLSVGTGAVGGSVYTTGSGWANVLNNKLAGKYEFTAEQTGGTVANISLIETGESEFAIAGCDVLYGAYTGTASWANGQKFVKPLAVFTCDMPTLCPFSLEGSGITTLADLNGKRVGLGPKGSSIDDMFNKVFAELNIVPAAIHNDTWSATVTALSDGVIDAVITQSTGQWPSLVELEATRDVSMMKMSDDELATIHEMFPYYTDSSIPAGTYKANENEEIKSLCVWACVIAGADVDEQIVYDICDATFSSYEDLSIINNALKLALPENASKVAVEWHPGARRWYEEHNITLLDPIEGLSPEQ